MQNLVTVRVQEALDKHGAFALKEQGYDERTLNQTLQYHYKGFDIFIRVKKAKEAKQ